jgi:uncharacterized membrane protein YraQ (UPF0718 family)
VPIDPTSLFALALAAMVVGPVTYRLASGGGWLAGLDAFATVAIVGLLLLHVMPDAIHELGVWALALLAAGWVIPGLVERSGAVSAKSAHNVAIWLAVAGLAVHTMLDGVAISSADPTSSGSTELAVAVVLHRIPVGMFVWAVPRTAYGKRTAAGLLVLIAISTLVGFGLGLEYMAGTGGPFLAGFQALVAGSLIHVALHQSPGHGHQKRGLEIRVGEFLGTLLAVGLLVGLSGLASVNSGYSTEVGLPAFTRRFVELSLLSAPALLLGYALAGILGTSLPRASVRWMGRGSHLAQSARGVLFGAPLPVCSCGVVPLYQSLITRGAPPAAAMAFLVATPELGIEAVILSVPLLGTELTIARVICAVAVALIVGWVVGSRAAASTTTPIEEKTDVEEMSLGTRVRKSVSVGFGDVLDETAPWILAGLAVAAVIDPAWLGSLMAGVPAGVDVALFAVVGVPLYVCASGATPLAAAFILGGVSPGAAVAFLLAGPATNVTTFGLLSRLHSRSIAALFGVTVIAMATVLGILVNRVVSVESALLSAAEHHDSSTLQIVCLGVLLFACVVSLYRNGPRAWIMTIVKPSSHEEEPDHCHDC